MEDELQHYGILGMKWGVRRYQNKDGTLTEAGKKHVAERKPLFTKKELEAAKNRNMDDDSDWAINDAMFLMLADYHPWITDENWGQEFDKFNSNPEKYIDSLEKIETYYKLSNAERTRSPIGVLLAKTEEYKNYADIVNKTEDQFKQNKKLDEELENKYIKALHDAALKGVEVSKQYCGMHDIGYEEAASLVSDMNQFNKVKHSDATDNFLEHHGILGMKWGIRRYQNEDGTLTDEGRKRLERKDTKWAHRKEDKIYNQTYKKARKETNKFVKELNKQISPMNKSGRLSATYVNAYNQRLAELMNKHVSDISSPSGKVVKWVAKRGDVGVHMALADPGYDLNQVRRGVYGNGRIAYRKTTVNTG